MTGRFLTDMADVLRRAGCHVVELDGWKTRARKSGGFGSGLPACIMWHHTASNGNGAQDANYCTFVNPDAPVANLVIGRDGIVYVCAAGATNTNGKGGPVTMPNGQVIPVDGMNSRAIGIEFSNNGVGMTWPEVQVDAGFMASNALAGAYMGGAYTNVLSHYAWAPTRKIDPAVAGAVQGRWKPRSINKSGTWNLDDLRAECTNRSGTSSLVPPSPQPPDQGDEGMVRLFDGFWKRDNSEAVYAIFRDGTKQWMTDPGYFNAMQALQRLAGADAVQLEVRTQNDPAMFAAFGIVIGPRPAGTDEWGNPV